MRYICDDPEHVKIETDGTIVCQYCYSAAKAKIKGLEKQKSFLISCIRSGEQLENDWEETLEER